MLHPATDLRKSQLEAREGVIGKLKDLLFDDESWTIRYLVATTGRWLPGRRVLVSPLAAVAGAYTTHKLPMSLTKDQIKQSPGEESDRPVSEQFQRELHAYYGWPAYWTVGPYPMAGMIPPVAVPPPGSGAGAVDAPAVAGDPHLRSIEHVTGYKIHALDGTIGHVEDFLVDLSDWTIRLVVVDTRDWLPGKKVLVTPAAVDRISWTDSEVSVHLTRDAIKDSPEWSGEPLDAEYEQRLAGYYDQLAVSR